jgi:hypothetical protein
VGGKVNGHGNPAQMMAARLLESGLGAREAGAMRLQALPPARTKALCATFMDRPAIKIPYFDLRAKENGFFRVRYLGEPTGFDALRAKALRYAQPPDTDPEVYLPPLCNWAEVARDPARAVMLTEGEFKAAAGTARVMPTIGLGGVWSWRQSKKGVPFIPALEAFQWQEREVRMCFDSDFSTNPDVMRALVALAKELSARGALPKMVALPDLPELLADGRKTGLDDFLVRKGPKALAKVFDDALPFDQAEALWAMNSEVVYIRDPGLVVNLADGRKMAPSAFKEHQFSNRHYWETQFDAKGNSKLVKKPLAPEWLKWEQRSELARVTYRPGAPRVAAGEYNYWPGWGAEARRGDVGPWRELLDYFFRGDKEARRWFEAWAAYPFQNPGEKMYAACAVWGAKHGTGKSLIGYMLGACYGKNFKEISDEELGGGFNAWAENRQFVMGDDVGSGQTGGTEAARRRATYEMVKFMVTRRTLTVNAKYMPEYEVPDCINYYFTANDPAAWALEDSDRRLFIWQAPEERLAQAFYERCDAWLKDPDGCGPALLWHLTHAVDCSWFNPRAAAMETAAKRAMIADGKGEAAAWVHALREDPEGHLRMGGVQLRGDLYSNAQLLQLYDPQGQRRGTANSLGREMKRAGFPMANGGETVRTARGPLRLYAVRNWEQWRKARAAECARHWDEHFSGGKPDKLAGEKK